MDSWLTQKDLDALTAQLNPSLQTGLGVDYNLQQLRSERSQILDFSTTVKTQTPTLLEFDKHWGFSYRRFDGASWHTELRDVYEDHALTSTQRQLKDAIDTLQVLAHTNLGLKWITPRNKNQQYDPRYQLLRQGNTWYCCIDLKIYQESTRRRRVDRGFTEITFSTKEKPVFDIETIDALLDKVCK
jgi:hypothetical protein